MEKATTFVVAKLDTPYPRGLMGACWMSSLIAVP